MVEIAKALSHLYPNSQSPRDWVVVSNEGVEKIAKWNSKNLGPQPTEQELELAIDSARSAETAKDEKKADEAAELEKLKADNNALDPVAALSKELDRLKKRVKALEDAAK